MAVHVDANTKVICQSFTATQFVFDCSGVFRSMRAYLLSTLLACTIAGSSQAQEARSGQTQETESSMEAAANMLRAAEQCLRNYRSAADIPGALTAAGFTVTPGMDAGTYEVTGNGIWGVVEPASAYCTFQSSEVPLSEAQTQVRSLSETLFPGKVEDGHPERGMSTPCDGISIFAPRQLIWVHYAQAGNSGECIDDGTSAIIMNM